MRTLITLSLISALVGCTSEFEAGAEAGVEPLLGSVGVLSIERSATSTQAGALAPDALLSAAFARYRGVSEAQVRALLASHESVEIDSCAFVAPEDELPSENADVELLDVGAIQVSLGNAQARLLPRTFPDVASVMAGVFYADEASLPVALEAQHYDVRAAGSAEVDGFGFSVDAPSALRSFGVDGTVVDQRVVFSRDADAGVTWEAGLGSDHLEIEIGTAHGSLVCAARDDGNFTIRRGALGALDPDAGAILTIRRVRTSEIFLPNIDRTFAQVSVSQTLDASVR